MQERITAVARARVFHQPMHGLRIAQHRREAVFAPGFRHFQRRLQEQDRRRIKLDMKTDDVIHDLGFADLRRRHDHDHFGAWIAHRIHHFALIWRTLRVPLPRLGATLAAQIAVTIRPLADRQVWRRG